MERNTKVQAEDGRHDILITREFDLSLELLFKAYTEPEIFEQWMGTKVVKFDIKPHGSFAFETTDPKGNKHRFHGTIHEVISNQKIIRTFEIENSPFPVQLEFLEFKELTPNTSKLVINMVFQSVEVRNQILQLPFVQGLNMALNRLEQIVSKLK